MELVDFLVYVLNGALGVVGSVLTAELRKVWPWMDQARDWVRFAVAWTISCALVTAVYMLLVGLEHFPMPEPTWQGWAQALFPYCFMAVGGSEGWFQTQKKPE